MAYKVKIDNVEYDLRDNFTIKDELNETLDSSTIQFNTYGQEANFESFDVAQIYDSENKISKKYFLVDSSDDEIHSFGSNFENDDHLYTVTLFSETKELERITLPNCSVTQPLTGTKHSVYYEIVRFCSLYVPRIKIYDAAATNNYVYTSKFSLDPALRTKFLNVVCPEFQWNNPTLREVLNDLMSTLDCIVVVKEGIISFYNLRQKGNPIDVSKLSLSKKTMSSQDYVGELTVDMQNAIGKTSSLICENVTLRAPEGSGSLTTSNGILNTMHPIYSIKKLRVKCPFCKRENENSIHSYAWIDITDRVLEKEEFDLLSNAKIYRVGHSSSIYYNLPNFTDSNGFTGKKHKVNFLYYKRGSKNISGFCDPYEISVDGIGNYRPSPTYFGFFGLAELAKHLQYISVEEEFGLDQVYDPRNLQFYLEYETLAEHAINFGKNLPVKHPENRIFDNQSNSYVDQEHLSIFEYAKINRLGHKLRTICGEYVNESEVPKLGDYIGDEILFSREVTYQDNILKFKGMLTPNYVLKDFFTGVRAKKRSWQIAKNEDALTRHDIYKWYLETSFNEKKDAINDSYAIASIGSGYFHRNLIPIGRYTVAPFEKVACAIRTQYGSTNYPNDDDYIFLDTEAAVLGKSICVHFGFNDNYKSADYIIPDEEELTNAFYPYANGDGEYTLERVILYPYKEKSGTDESATIIDKNDLVAEIREGYSKPKISILEIFPASEQEKVTISSIFTIKVNKDNREIIHQTIQYELCSDSKDIIIFDNFFKKIPFFNRTETGSERIYFSTEKYDENDTEVKGTYYSDARISRTNSTNNIKIKIVTSGGEDYPVPSNIKSCAICSSDNKLLMAVNIPNESSVVEVWFNLLRSRDDKIYSDTYNGIIVGDITPQGIANAPTNYAAITTRVSANVNVQRRLITRSETISGSDEENE